MSENSLLVCMVGGKKYYGNEYEYIAARLNEGDKILFNGIDEVVSYTWFYDGLNIQLKSGKVVSAGTGDKFLKL